MFRKKELNTPLDAAIATAFIELAEHEVSSDEYDEVLNRLSKLYELKENTTPRRVSPDTWVMAAANLTGILLVIRHEHLNVITSRAMGMLPKLK